MDSRPDTERHIEEVRALIFSVIGELQDRAHDHDHSKLEEPQKAVFDRVTGQLAELTYGSEGYRAALADMKPALDDHYAKESHHPEHHPGGIGDMSLIDLVEMLCDWIAAGRRHADGGDPHRSIDLNAERFGYGEELRALLHNSVAAIEANQVPVT